MISEGAAFLEHRASPTGTKKQENSKPSSDCRIGNAGRVSNAKMLKRKEKN
jgi:hypothetical protein